MKKLIAIFVVVAILTSMSVSVSAATTTLTTTVPEASYTLNIPADQEIPFGTTETSIGNITVTDSEGFADGKNLNVTITYADFSAENTSTTIPYTLELYAKSGSTSGSSNYKESSVEIASNSTITFEGTSAGNVKENTYIGSNVATTGIPIEVPVTSIIFNAESEDWGKALAGEYSSIITFTAEVVAE